MLKKVRRIVIFGNGTLHQAYVSWIKKDDFVIGVDRAALWLLAHRRKPDIAIGDFDSVTQAEYRRIASKVSDTRKFPREKDFTDMELAVQVAIAVKPKEVLIVGGIGTRWDHTEATVQLLMRFMEEKIPASVRDEQNEITLLQGRRTIYRLGEYRFVSVLPFTDEIVVSMSGFLYPTRNLIIRRGQSIGVSNELTGERGHISVLSGTALVMRSRDEW